MEAKVIWVLASISFFTMVMMFVSLGAMNLANKAWDNIEKIKSSDRDVRIDNLNRFTITKLAQEEYERGSLRIIRRQDFEMLVMFALKHSEISRGKAAALLGLNLGEMRLLCNKWEANDYDLPG